MTSTAKQLKVVVEMDYEAVVATLLSIDYNIERVQEMMKTDRHPSDGFWQGRIEELKRAKEQMIHMQFA